MMIFVDKRKNAKKLLLDAKDEGETNKFALGTMRVQKDEVFLTCEKKPPAGLAKRVKKYLKLIKLPGAPSRVIIVDGNGQTLEDDGDQDSATKAEKEASVAAKVDPAQAKWEASIAKVKPQAVARIKAGGPVADKLKDALKMGKVRAEAGDYTAAMKTLPAIAKLLNTPDAQAETEQQAPPVKQKSDQGPAQQFQARRTEVMKLLSAALKQFSPHVGAAQTALKEAMEAAKAKDFTAGLAALDQVATILAQPVPMEPPADDTVSKKEDLPDEPSELEGRLISTARALQKSLLPSKEIERLSKALTRARKLLKNGDEENCKKLLDLIASAFSSTPPTPKPSGREIAAQVRDVWDDAYRVVGNNLDGLRKALGAFDDPNCQELADKGLISFTGGLQVKLNKSFLELQSASPEKIDKACAQAEDTFRAFQSMLDSNEAVKLIDDNDFGVPIGLKSTLGDALNEMRGIVSDPTASVS
ncbi:hypothetical protein [Actibacterium pelagium]|nr:hypothetical protein [Actibacterium pelagium]